MILIGIPRRGGDIRVSYIVRRWIVEGKETFEGMFLLGRRAKFGTPFIKRGCRLEATVVSCLTKLQKKACSFLSDLVCSEASRAKVRQDVRGGGDRMSGGGEAVIEGVLVGGVKRNSGELVGCCGDEGREKSVV